MARQNQGTMGAKARNSGWLPHNNLMVNGVKFQTKARPSTSTASMEPKNFTRSGRVSVDLAWAADTTGNATILKAEAAYKKAFPTRAARLYRAASASEK